LAYIFVVFLLIAFSLVAVSRLQSTGVTPNHPLPTTPQGLTGYVFAGSARDYRVVGAVVEVEVENNVYSATTGPYGEYVVRGVPVGTWTARVKMAGTVKTTENVTVASDQFTAKEWSNVAPELIPNGSVDGVYVVNIPSDWQKLQELGV
jgi:hypothetical protein